MPKILLIQGPNLSYLGRRQPEIYGKTSAAELDAKGRVTLVLKDSESVQVARFNVDLSAMR